MESAAFLSVLLSLSQQSNSNNRANNQLFQHLKTAMGGALEG